MLAFVQFPSHTYPSFFVAKHDQCYVNYVHVHVHVQEYIDMCNYAQGSISYGCVHGKGTIILNNLII